MDNNNIKVYDNVYDKVKDILGHFDIKGDYANGYVYGNGLINDTYVAEINNNGKIKRYIIQRINDKVFKNVPALMNNIVLVTAFLKKKIKAEGGNAERETLTLIYTKDNKPYCSFNGNYYRIYVFIEGATTYQMVEREEDFYQSAIASAVFQRRLSDFDAKLLHTSIPDFHNTPVRFNNLKKAINDNLSGRIKEVTKEIDFALSREKITDKIMKGLSSGDISLKVTHNDTKLNNIMIDNETRKQLCVIDLDTIMPGSVLFDYGDAIRSGCNTAKECEKDLTKVNFNKKLFKVYSEGYMSEAKNVLNKEEKSLLTLSSKLMTFECGMRFLTDFLNGDTYFKTTYKEQNLDRTRTQFKLVSDIENSENELNKFIESL